jgi:hypothetical protein
MTVKNIRFISGENVIADLMEESADEIVIRDAIVAMPINQEGTQLGFAPWAPLQDPDIDDLTVNKRHVMYITKPAPNLEQQYNQMFSRVITPDKKIII